MLATPIYIGGRAPLSLGSFTLVVDLTPSDLLGVLSPGTDGPQCSTCSFVSFLRGVPDLDRYSGLSEVRAGFDRLPELAFAIASDDAEGVRRVGHAIGASVCYELVADRPGRLNGVPKIQVRARGAAAQGASNRDWGLASPDGRGNASLLHQLRCLRIAGFNRAKIGYYEHGAAVEGWSAFSETASFDQWPAVMAEAKLMGFEHLGFAMAYSPCTALQWRANRSLEQLRARLDVHFRRMDGDSSMMCPENVSGYGLLNDTREFIAHRAPAARRLSLRYESVVLEFS